ncbi:hypothetical protein ACOMHN_064669 [Nucella lapillus]
MRPTSEWENDWGSGWDSSTEAAPTRQGKAQWKRGEEPLLNEAAEATAKTRKRTGTWMLSKQHAANHRPKESNGQTVLPFRRRDASGSASQKRPRSSDRSPPQPGQEKHQRRDASQARGLESSGDEYSDVAAGVKQTSGACA